jgi:hypothetical protein
MRSDFVTEQHWNATAPESDFEYQSRTPDQRGEPRTGAQAVAAGLDFLFAELKESHWSDFTLLGSELEVWVTAWILVRLGDLSPKYTQPFQQQVTEAIRWLAQAGTTEGWGMARGEAPDADTTSLAVIALRKFGREVPRAALDFIRNCQRPNGGFAPYPETSTADHLFKLSAPDTTVAAVQALGTPNPRAEEFLASRVQDWPVPWCRLSSRFHLCAEILGSESGTASWPLLHKVSQLMSYYPRESPFEQAAYLRCAFRLQIQRTGTVASRLRSMQSPDGSWPASAALGPAMPGVVVRHRRHPLIVDDKKTLTTAAAVSALAMHEGQPGLYFGSDLPRPRRLSTT